MKVSKVNQIGWALLMAVVGIGITRSPLSAQTVTADFANRSGNTKWVPSGVFAVAGTGSSLQDVNAIASLQNAGLNQTRIFADLSQIYANGSANWSNLDWDLQLLKNAGVKPLVIIVNTPPALQPGGNPCGNGNNKNAPPTSYYAWGQDAAAVVAHLDQSFRGMATDYEIWNEPELPASLCVTDDTTRMNTYVGMFAAAGAAMHARAILDGVTINTGGPVISRMAVAPTWIPALLNNSGSAPYVNFVSFHLYITGQTDINNGMNWSTLWSVTQSATQGLEYFYKRIIPLVRAGHQPNPYGTPIYLSEYNDNWAFSKDCCRNDPTYGPLWNSVAITDLLDTVYHGADQVPSKLTYFASSQPPYFCIVGQWNTNMDCNQSSLNAYPQFYAYKLFASSQYLNLQAGAHMAASVTPSSNGTGLMATAFYTSTSDQVVIVNPTATSYNSVPVTIVNPGLPGGVQGTQYLLNSSHGTISTWSLAVSSVPGGYRGYVSVPAYSTVAVSVK